MTVSITNYLHEIILCCTSSVRTTSTVLLPLSFCLNRLFSRRNPSFTHSVHTLTLGYTSLWYPFHFQPSIPFVNSQNMSRRKQKTNKVICRQSQVNYWKKQKEISVQKSSWSLGLSNKKIETVNYGCPWVIDNIYINLFSKFTYQANKNIHCLVAKRNDYVTLHNTTPN